MWCQTDPLSWRVRNFPIQYNQIVLGLQYCRSEMIQFFVSPNSLKSTEGPFALFIRLFEFSTIPDSFFLDHRPIGVLRSVPTEERTAWMAGYLCLMLLSSEEYHR